jgi:MoxR-like ATPase
MEKTDLKLIEKLQLAYESINKQLEKIIIGQKNVIDELLIALFSKGHALIVGVPGLAKTLLVSTIAQILNLKFKRIQFTPDLMPSDITGTEVIEEDPSGKRYYRFIKGPVFANIILADEINRTPPKTQSALLQAMQEYKVTVGNITYELEQPFFVIATQNPIEQEGTYPLPEAQLDRFLFQINIDYPTKEEEKKIVLKTTGTHKTDVEKILSANEIIELQEIVRKVPISDNVLEYVINLVRSTRPNDHSSPDFIKNYISWGAGPRATQALVLGGKARAILKGRFTVSIEDISLLLHPVLRHRLILNFRADAEGITVSHIIDQLHQTIPSFPK